MNNEGAGLVTPKQMASVIQTLNSFPDPARKNRAQRRKNVKGTAIRKSASSRKIAR